MFDGERFKQSQGKPDYTLLDKRFLEGLIAVMQRGKYMRDSWRVGIERHKLMAAAARHLFAMIDGEDYDKESGVNHMYHVTANMMMLSAHEDRERMNHWRREFEDRETAECTKEELDALLKIPEKQEKGENE